MKRFTKRIDEHVYYTMGKHSETLPAECTSQDVRQILKHLADYEDSNLTPGEISSLITTIESQKEEIETGIAVHIEYMNTNKRLAAEIESLKAITELAVKGLTHYADETFYEFYGMGTAALEDKGDSARLILAEIERLSHE